MKDYHDLYLKFDVLILASVFETFRKESINSFSIRSCSFFIYSWLQLWYNAIRFRHVNLKLISDIDKHQFVEITIRSGISMICKDYAEVNNKLLKSFDANKPRLYIIQIDANNLYENSMMHFLLTEILDWVDPKDFTKDNYSNHSLIECF